MAKLHPKIHDTTQDQEFPDILMEKQVQADEFSDFIEVHVYGDIHPAAFRHVVAQVSDDPVEKTMWERTRMRLERFDITFEEVSA